MADDRNRNIFISVLIGFAVIVALVLGIRYFMKKKASSGISLDMPSSSMVSSSTGADTKSSSEAPQKKSPLKKAPVKKAPVRNQRPQARKKKPS